MITKLNLFVAIITIFQTLNFGCNQKTTATAKNEVVEVIENEEITIKKPILENKTVLVGAAQFEKYENWIADKNLALLVNQTSTVGNAHLVDTLLHRGATIKTIFAPEHGFRGTADAGEKILYGKDTKTGLPVISLYGKNKKPTAAQLQGIDIVVFDIQDVGARFYTYISSMSYVMEACAEQNIPFLVLDRPNPNGHYVDGPVLEKGFESFVGLHQVSVVHGMTVAEYAQMVNAENWLKNGVKCDLKIVPCQNYDHTVYYKLPTKPSPNLPNMPSIYLYPSLCFFEGTSVSVGRGTNLQFQVVGAPDFAEGTYSFTPKPMPGAKYPKHDGVLCKGWNLSEYTKGELKINCLNIRFLHKFYQDYKDKNNFFLKNNFLNKLAGNSTLKKQLQTGKTVEEIRASWQPRLSEFKAMRKQYLLYADFE
jgi:uncharacterized protein YbbC (DUF1343 family)